MGNTTPEVVNGWTISQRNGEWQAVKNGVRGYSHSVKEYVLAFARTNK